MTATHYTRNAIRDEIRAAREHNDAPVSVRSLAERTSLSTTTVRKYVETMVEDDERIEPVHTSKATLYRWVTDNELAEKYRRAALRHEVARLIGVEDDDVSLAGRYSDEIRVPQSALLEALGISEDALGHTA